MNPEVDLWGSPILGDFAPVLAESGKRKATRPNGYAAPPGSGPAGETCRTCRHYTYVQCSKRYLKCALMRPRWTNGPGTDIKARAPACSYWENPQ